MTTSDKRPSPALMHELGVLLTAFWYEVDQNRGAVASSYFTPDAVLRFEDASFRGTAQIDAVYQGRAARGSRVSRHIITNLHLLESEGDGVRAISTLLLFADDGEPPRPTTSPTLIADVWDEFEYHNGKWLISSRWIRNLFLGSSADLAVPIR